MSMKVYEDLRGTSGITGYRISEDDNSVDIQFRSGKTYTYTRANLGHANFEVMKALAKSGAGLCGFLTELRGQYTPNPEPTPIAAVNIKVDAGEAVSVITELLNAGIRVSLN